VTKSERQKSDNNGMAAVLAMPEGRRVLQVLIESSMLFKVNPSPGDAFFEGRRQLGLETIAWARQVDLDNTTLILTDILKGEVYEDDGKK
jgi:hypothetical protein